MNLEQFLELVRSGKIKITSHYSVIESRTVLSPKIEQSYAADAMEVIKANQGAIWFLIHKNDVEVCTDLINHKPYHVAATIGDHEYIRCDECARMRKLEEPTDEEILAEPEKKIELQKKRYSDNPTE